MWGWLDVLPGGVELWVYLIKFWVERILWLITFLVLGNFICLFCYIISIYRFLLYGLPFLTVFVCLQQAFFFCLSLKKNQEKHTHTTCPFGYPALLLIVVSLKTRFAQTVQTLVSTITAMLGCVSMGQKCKKMGSGTELQHFIS